MNIACVKTGDLYNAEYVNKLYSMVSRHISIPFTFHCLTDNSDGLNEGIESIDVDKDYGGWWNKLTLFTLFEGDVLFLDLDTIIVNEIDTLVHYGSKELDDNRLVILEDFNVPNGYGSGVMMFRGKDLAFIYDSFIESEETIKSKYHGDQDYIEYLIKDVSFFPRDLILSYKVDKVRDTPKEASVVCFHGKPKNHEVTNEGWVQEHWI